MAADTSTITMRRRLLSWVFLLASTCSAVFLVGAAASTLPSFDAIYNFGDSISDTGNLLQEGVGQLQLQLQLGAFSNIASLPYGQTYFHHPTGRCSDGLLMLDIIAMKLGLPLLNPYFERKADFHHGVNFAVAGATAVSPWFWASQGIQMPFANTSLQVQLDWFKAHLSSTCFSKFECGRMLNKALFLVGEIGGNDYNYSFLQGKSMEEVIKYVPTVVQTIKDAARQLIEIGAVHLVIPGNFPIGCVPVYLTTFQIKDQASYDENKCLKTFNEFAMLHNNHLQEAIKELREEFPNALIAYADYYNALLEIITHAEEKGFEKNSTVMACCGSGGDYYFNMMRMCGAPGVRTCTNPERYLNWDGVHMTQAAHEHMARQLIFRLAREWGLDA